MHMKGERTAARVVQGIVIAVFSAAMIYTAIGITDSIPPTVFVSDEVTVNAGDGMPDGILDVTDNFTSREKIVVRVDTSRVDFNTEGVYDASVSATDLNGNTCVESFRICVSAGSVTRQMLDDELDIS